jgi:hypothetical protein
MAIAARSAMRMRIENLNDRVASFKYLETLIRRQQGCALYPGHEIASEGDGPEIEKKYAVVKAGSNVGFGVKCSVLAMSITAPRGGVRLRKDLIQREISSDFHSRLKSIFFCD